MWYTLLMKRREFLKALGVVPAVPLVAKLPEINTRPVDVPPSPEMTATEVIRRNQKYQEIYRAEFIKGFPELNWWVEAHQSLLRKTKRSELL